ncbi:hypothetical protein IMG5_193570 [Ichthyophthirius multifiliis]|uniref:Chromo domain-containing protein n=1 Tax=Ichthyophthirius multifiliis TaxID=5932 RepID=G0R4K6_ICHMU|nr:hypothetical protein IMG5_193570 [Ichthyophthirius multifiliis]EGR27604.1 hypothetical protein IMG5_193570 [Ichthyophthirius multifiliis]|eukprot:XP_004025056.1 hypothetical protein IMG5_193570 [Ichthyophthirius multifiliis]
MSIKYKINPQKNKAKSSKQDEYQVEEIIDSRINQKTKKKEYLIKWENWDIQDATWEPIENLENVKEIIQRYEKKLGKKETEKKPTQTPQNQIKKPSNNQEDSDVQIVEQKKRGPKSNANTENTTNKPKMNKYHNSSEESQEENSSENDKNQLNTSKKSEQDEEYVFEEFLDKKSKNGQTQYLVKFQGKRNFEDLKELIQGDFKTDNVEKIETEREFDARNLHSVRFEVFWKTRGDGITPKSSFFSYSYLKNFYPIALVDYFVQQKIN